MNIEKNLSERILVGQSSLQSGDDTPQTFDEYQLPPELPKRESKRAICIDHIQSGVAQELITDFQLGGVHFPERDEPQEITTQFSCKGTRCILKRCGLKIEQFDSTGKKIGKMKAAN
jgi:hypothetical protein